MGSGVGSRTISLPIKHAWGESFIAGRNKATLPSPRVSTSHRKSLFPWQPNWHSLYRNGKEVQTEAGVMGELCGGMRVCVDLNLTLKVNASQWFPGMLNESTSFNVSVQNSKDIEDTKL